jgi:hypothetical protein
LQISKNWYCFCVKEKTGQFLSRKEYDMKKYRFLAVVALLGTSVGAYAAETITYKYDARGRLIEIKRTGTVNNNVQSNYTHDKANNRKTVVVTGSGNAPPP